MIKQGLVLIIFALKKILIENSNNSNY